MDRCYKVLVRNFCGFRETVDVIWNTKAKLLEQKKEDLLIAKNVPPPLRSPWEIFLKGNEGKSALIADKHLLAVHFQNQCTSLNLRELNRACLSEKTTDKVESF